MLAYKLSGLESMLSDEMINKYRKDTRPEGLLTQKEVDEIKALLTSTIKKTESDYANGVFKNYNAYTVSTTGNTLIAPGGNYDVTVTDVNGLQATGQVFIPQSGGILAPTYTTADTCSPTILTLSAGINTADSYSWSGPYGFNFTGSDTTIQNAYVYQSGAYSVIASYNNGCTAYGNMYVQIAKPCFRIEL